MRTVRDAAAALRLFANTLLIHRLCLLSLQSSSTIAVQHFSMKFRVRLAVGDPLYLALGAFCGARHSLRTNGTQDVRDFTKRNMDSANVELSDLVAVVSEGRAGRGQD